MERAVLNAALNAPLSAPGGGPENVGPGNAAHPTADDPHPVPR
jgi:hypothetical protein